MLVAPIGFICDHVETLFDIDIELKQLAARKGLQLERMAMLNDSPALVETLADVLETADAELFAAAEQALTNVVGRLARLVFQIEGKLQRGEPAES